MNASEMKPWDLVALGLTHKTAGNMLIRGGSAIGKNQRIYRSIGAPGKDYLILNMTSQTSKEDAFGHFVPNDKSFLEWMHNAVTRCMEEGIVLVINEIDKAVSGEAQDVLLFICESFKSCMVTLPNGKQTVVKAKPGYRVIATMNGNFNDLPDNILTRFPIKIDVGLEIDPQAIEALPVWARPLTRQYKDLPQIFNLRTIFPFAEAHAAGMPLDVAAMLYFGKSYASTVATAVLVAQKQHCDDVHLSQAAKL